MKTKLIISAAVLSLGLFSGMAKAQQRVLAADQNPRYRESAAKYANVADSLTKEQGTTIQNTYKAYDWYQDRLDRRAQNREWTHQEIMNGSYYTPTFSVFGNYGYPFGGYGNYGYGNRWGRGGFRGGRSSIGIGFGW